MAVITLRVTDRIHDQIRAAAKAERVSMNQFCILAIHAAVTTLDSDARKRVVDITELVVKQARERAPRGE